MVCVWILLFFLFLYSRVENFRLANKQRGSRSGNWLTSKLISISNNARHQPRVRLTLYFCIFVFVFNLYFSLRFADSKIKQQQQSSPSAETDFGISQECKLAPCPSVDPLSHYWKHQLINCWVMFCDVLIMNYHWFMV